MNVHDPFRPIGANDSVVDSVGCASVQLPDESFAGKLAFVGMKQMKEAFVCDFRGRIHPENAECFVRPARRMLVTIFGVG